MKSLFMPPKKSVPMPELFPVTPPVTPPVVSPAERVKLLTRVAGFYQRTFMDSQEGLRYLTKVCGIRDVSLFKTFQIGYANGTLTEVLPKDRETQAALTTCARCTASSIRANNSRNLLTLLPLG